MSLNRVLSDYWNSQGCEMGARVVKWVRTGFSISQSNSQPLQNGIWDFHNPAKFSQGMRNALFFLLQINLKSFSICFGIHLQFDHQITTK